MLNPLEICVFQVFHGCSFCLHWKPLLRMIWKPLKRLFSYDTKAVEEAVSNDTKSFEGATSNATRAIEKAIFTWYVNHWKGCFKETGSLMPHDFSTLSYKHSNMSCFSCIWIFIPLESTILPSYPGSRPSLEILLLKR